MHIILKIALTVDGYIAEQNKRLLISSKEDLEQVNEIRKEVDAILIGANTLRVDNPSLLAKGIDKQPIRVVISQDAKFDESLNLFSDNKSRTVVYHANSEITDKKDFFFLEKLTLSKVLKHIEQLGVGKLLVEGGAKIFKQFYEQGLFSELRISVGEKFLGSLGVGFDLNKNNNIKLKSIDKLGSSAVHLYIKV